MVLVKENISKDLYKQIIYKYNAVVRYEIYQGVKSVDSLDDDKLFEIIGSLDLNHILEQVFKLFNAPWDLDASLHLRKLEYKFQADLGLSQYVNCLNEAHEQMLLII